MEKERNKNATTAWHPPEDLIYIQSRAEMDFSLVDEYAGMMEQGIKFDPCDGILDDIDDRIYIWDGYHRGAAAKQINKPLLVRVSQGTQEEAEWLAFGANQKHGLRRTYKDIARVVKAALCHPNGKGVSDREIARHCGVDHKTVGKYRKELEVSGEIPQLERRTVTRDGSTYEMTVKKAKKVGEDASASKEVPEEMLADIAVTCAFCQKTEAEVGKIHQAGQSGTGICESCATKALHDMIGDQLEFNWYTEDRDKLVSKGFRVFRIDWGFKHLREYRQAKGNIPLYSPKEGNISRNSWQRYGTYSSKTKMKEEIAALRRDRLVVFENH